MTTREFNRLVRLYNKHAARVKNLPTRVHNTAVPATVAATDIIDELSTFVDDMREGLDDGQS